jgi:hypothetical protein
MVSKDITIDENYLKELIDFVGSSTCGKIMKRHEILQGNSEAIKLDTKELIYEGFRELRSLIIAQNMGREITIFKFRKKQPNHSTQNADNAQ